MPEKPFNPKFRVYALLLISCLLLIFSISLLFLKPVETLTLNVNFQVGNTPGFNLNNSLLNFGQLTPGSSSTRNVFIYNRYNFSIQVKALVSKGISGFLYFQPDIILGINKALLFQLD